MLLFSNIKKYKKYHRLSKKINQKEFNKISPNIGFGGIQLLHGCRISSTQIEAVRKVITKLVRRKYRINLCINSFPDLPITKKASGVRMGKGYGRLDHWVSVVKCGKICFEIDSRLPKEILLKAFLMAGIKLPSTFKIYI